MIAVEHVRRFVDDRRSTLGAMADEIIARAEATAEDGLITSLTLREVFEDDELADELGRLISTDRAYMQISLDDQARRRQE